MTYGSTPYCSKCGKRIVHLADLTDAVMDALKLCCRACVSIPLTITATLTEIAEPTEYAEKTVLDTQAAA